MTKKKNLKTVQVRSLTAKKRLKCPSCNTIGEYETDDRLETYCKKCGLIIESPYPYTAGNRYDLLSDILYKRKLKVRELKWKQKRKKS